MEDYVHGVMEVPEDEAVHVDLLQLFDLLRLFEGEFVQRFLFVFCAGDFGGRIQQKVQTKIMQKTQT